MANVKELKAAAKAAGLVGYSGLDRDGLERLLAKTAKAAASEVVVDRTVVEAEQRAEMVAGHAELARVRRAEEAVAAGNAAEDAAAARTVAAQRKHDRMHGIIG